jgi:hypothetical protein
VARRKLIAVDGDVDLPGTGPLILRPGGAWPQERQLAGQLEGDERLAAGAVELFTVEQPPRLVERQPGRLGDAGPVIIDRLAQQDLGCFGELGGGQGRRGDHGRPSPFGLPAQPIDDQRQGGPRYSSHLVVAVNEALWEPGSVPIAAIQRERETEVGGLVATDDEEWPLLPGHLISEEPVAPSHRVTERRVPQEVVLGVGGRRSRIFALS